MSTPGAGVGRVQQSWLRPYREDLRAVLCSSHRDHAAQLKAQPQQLACGRQHGTIACGCMHTGETVSIWNWPGGALFIAPNQAPESISTVMFQVIYMLAGEPA
jgi:hypothetical protein